MTLRHYQLKAKQEVYDAWAAGFKFPLVVMPTGSGKTRLFCAIVAELNWPTVAIAHRKELVTQMSKTLAENGIRHRVIGPLNVIKACVAVQMMTLGKSYYDSNANVAVAGIDTLVNREDELYQFRHRVKLIIQDEAHHVVQGNKWAKGFEMFPNAKGLGVTASPQRADGKGLGVDSDGLFDCIIIGPTMRELIAEGYLSEYEIYIPPNDLDMSDVNITATGDYNNKKAGAAVRQSRIIGDVVMHYQRHADGKLGVTFAPDVETATLLAERFNAAGVRAEVVTAKTKDKVRTEMLQRFAAGEIKQLVNVDLFGEGFDLPAIECVSMARPTASYALFIQQFGRALRPLAGKERAIIFDHVGNFLYHFEKHGNPADKTDWTLDGGKRRGGGVSDAIPMTRCQGCAHGYERTFHACPYCGHVNEPADRSSPEAVDGDLVLLDESVYSDIQKSIKQRDADIGPGYVKDAKTAVIARNHYKSQAMTNALRQSLDWWGAFQRAQGRDDRESYKRFYFMFGVDIMTCQTLDYTKSLELAEKINYKLAEMS